MSKKAKVLIVVAAVVFLAMAGMMIYFRTYYRFVRVPSGMIFDSSAKVAEDRSFKPLK